MRNCFSWIFTRNNTHTSRNYGPASAWPKPELSLKFLLEQQLKRGLPNLWLQLNSYMDDEYLRNNFLNLISILLKLPAFVVLYITYTIKNSYHCSTFAVPSVRFSPLSWQSGLSVKSIMILAFTIDGYFDLSFFPGTPGKGSCVDEFLMVPDGSFLIAAIIFSSE